MGTNYYWHESEPDGDPDVCPCGAIIAASEHRVLHVGKQSVGWAFHFRVYEGDLGPKNSREWREVMDSRAGVLLDEYGTRHSITEFWVMADDPERKAQLDDKTFHPNANPRPRQDLDFRDEYGHRCSTGEFS